MLIQLSGDDQRWVEDTFSSMTLEEKVGHLLCPMDRGDSAEAYLALLKNVPLGTLFVAPSRKAEEVTEVITKVQAASRIPLLVAADIESGMGGPLGFGDRYTEFPSSMACGAAGSARSVYEIGMAIGREARSLGIHWSFAPVVDINLNPRNAVVNYRAFGDDPAMVREYAVQRIAGMQKDHLLAACAKHFPGDGVDERDQHFCTSINALPLEQWWKTYGLVWEAVVQSGVMSIMSGHISFPAYEGVGDRPRLAMPATLSRKLQVDLLRKELGFQGVIISDAAPMGGFTSRLPADRLVVENILAGSDIYLFADPIEDFASLMKAVSTGIISKDRLDESVLRILSMKARLGLHKKLNCAPATAEESGEFHAISQRVTDQAVTVLRRGEGVTAKLKPGSRALLVNVIPGHATRMGISFDTLEQDLHRHGIQTVSLNNPEHREIIKICDEFEWIFVNLCVIPHGVTGTIRMAGDLLKPFYRCFWVGKTNVTFTSFCSPYVLYDLPEASNMLCAYDYSKASQRSAVKVWLGQLEPVGKRPVTAMIEEL